MGMRSQGPEIRIQTDSRMVENGSSVPNSLSDILPGRSLDPDILVSPGKQDLLVEKFDHLQFSLYEFFGFFPGECLGELQVAVQDRRLVEDIVAGDARERVAASGWQGAGFS